MVKHSNLRIILSYNVTYFYARINQSKIGIKENLLNGSMSWPPINLDTYDLMYKKVSDEQQKAENQPMKQRSENMFCCFQLIQIAIR
jgi:hypothetical protein